MVLPFIFNQPYLFVLLSDDDENKEGENFKLMVYGQPEEQREAETRETSLAFGSTAAKDNFISILSPSSSFPSLRSLSSLSLPKQDVKPTYLSSSHIKFMRHDNGDSSRIATHQANGFLERVNFFLGMAPTAMTLDHDLDISPHSIPLSSLVASEEGAGRTVSSLHRSHTFSDFSMIAIWNSVFCCPYSGLCLKQSQWDHSCSKQVHHLFLRRNYLSLS